MRRASKTFGRAFKEGRKCTKRLDKFKTPRSGKSKGREESSSIKQYKSGKESGVVVLRQEARS